MKSLIWSWKTATSIVVLLILAFVVMSLFGGGDTHQRQTGNQILSQIVYNLKAQNIEVLSSSVKQDTPLRISIALSDTGDSMTKAINIHMARREAALAFRNGIPVSSIEFSIPNASEPGVWWGESFFYESDKARFGMGFAQSNVSLAEAGKGLSAQFQILPKTISIKKIDLAELPSISASVRTALLTAEISSSGETVAFLSEVREGIARTNKYGSNIALIRIKMFDLQGKQVVDYFWDEEMRVELSMAAPGIDLGRPNPPPLPVN